MRWVNSVIVSMLWLRLPMSNLDLGVVRAEEPFEAADVLDRAEPRH